MRSLALSLLLLSAAPALAQEAAASPQPQAKPPAQGETKKKKVIRLDAVTVEGRIQKPQAYYFLNRSNLTFDDLHRTESFVPKVVKSVDKEPF